MIMSNWQTTTGNVASTKHFQISMMRITHGIVPANHLSCRLCLPVVVVVELVYSDDPCCYTVAPPMPDRSKVRFNSDQAGHGHTGVYAVCGPSRFASGTRLLIRRAGVSGLRKSTPPLYKSLSLSQQHGRGPSQLSARATGTVQTRYRGSDTRAIERGGRGFESIEVWHCLPLKSRTPWAGVVICKYPRWHKKKRITLNQWPLLVRPREHVPTPIRPSL